MLTDDDSVWCLVQSAQVMPALAHADCHHQFIVFIQVNLGPTLTNDKVTGLTRETIRAFWWEGAAV